MNSKILSLYFFFKANDGITLFLPQEITIFESKIKSLFKTDKEAGVKNGGTNSQIFLILCFGVCSLILKPLLAPQLDLSYRAYLALKVVLLI